MNADGLWDVALWVVAGYIAFVALVRLMLNHRDRQLAAFRAEVAAEAERQRQVQAAERKAAAKAKRAG